MHIDLAGKTAVVTGSSSGIGLAAAKGLASAGAHVILVDKKPELLDAAVAAVKVISTQAEVHGFLGDPSSKTEAAALFASHPYCDILVNNLAFDGWRDFFESTDEEWEAYGSVNVTSGLRLSRLYMPRMMKLDWGRVLFLSSVAATNVPADMIYYSATRSSQLSLARGLAKRTAGTGVTVNSILPPPTLTAALVAMDALERIYPSPPTAKQVLAIEELVNMIVYIASPLAADTTGAELRLEGGGESPSEEEPEAEFGSHERYAATSR